MSQQLLDDACRRGDPALVRQFLQHEGTSPGVALHWASTAEVIQELLNGGANIDHQDTSKRTPLHGAVIQGSKELVACLLDRGANMEVSDAEGDKPIHVAGNCKGVAHLLLDRGANIESKDKRGLTPLNKAAKRGDAAFCELLLSRHADLNTVDSDGNTPLHLAAGSWNNAEVLRLILAQRGTSAEAQNDNSCAPLDLANNKEASAPRVSQGPDIEARNSRGYTPLHVAAGEAAVRLLIESGASVEARNIYGMTPLHVVVEYEDSALPVRLLLDSGADKEAKDSKGRTPLHFAACNRRCCSEIVSLLLDQGASIEARDNLGNTPLHTFFLRGFSVGIAAPVVQIMLGKSADIEACNNENTRPLHLAAQACFPVRVVRLFLDRGAAVNVQDKSGMTPLHFAAVNEHDGVRPRDEFDDWFHHPEGDDAEECDSSVQLLLERKANPNVVDTDGRTPLHHIALKRRSDKKVVQLLLDHNADPNAADKDGKTVLHHAAGKRCPDIGFVQLLLNHNANPNISDKGGKTPLHCAVRDPDNNDENESEWEGHGNGDENANLREKLVQLLSEHTVDPNAKDKEGKTVLHHAAEYCDTKVVELLLNKGSDALAEDTSRMTPMFYGAINKNPGSVPLDTVRLLLERTVGMIQLPGSPEPGTTQQRKRPATESPANDATTQAKKPKME